MKRNIIKVTSLSFLTAVTTSLALLSSAAHADTSWMNKVKPFKIGTHPKLKPTKLEYVLSWKGTVKAGEITFDFNKKDKRYKGLDISQAYGRSQNMAYAVFPYHINMTSFSNENTQKPVIFVVDEKDKREIIKTTNTFKPNGVQFVSKEDNFIKKKKQTKNHFFNYSNTHDPLTAIQYIRSQSLRNGEKLYLCLHPVGSPMFSEVTVLGRETHNGRRCIKLDIKLQKIDVKTMNLKAYKKLKKATLWISDDADRIMVELRSQVFIGDVRVVLKKQSRL